jgi:hypothetical protein
MNTNTKIEIEIEHDFDGFYGADENRDQDEAESAYEQAVNVEILKIYPQAEISHEWGYFYSADVTVFIDDETDTIDSENIAEVVRNIETVIYSDGAFWGNLI